MASLANDPRQLLAAALAQAGAGPAIDDDQPDENAAPVPTTPGTPYQPLINPPAPKGYSPPYGPPNLPGGIWGPRPRGGLAAALAGEPAPAPAPMTQVASTSSSVPLPASPSEAEETEQVSQAPQEDATITGYRTEHDAAVTQYKAALAKGDAALAAGNTDAAKIYFSAAAEQAKRAEAINDKAIEYNKPLKSVTAGQHVYNPSSGKYEQPVPEEESTRAPNQEEVARLTAAGHNPKNFQVTDGKLEPIAAEKGDSRGFGIIGEDQFGNKQYGFTDKTTGEVTPYRPPTGAPGAFSQNLDLHGDDFMKTLNPQIAGQVRAIVEGRAPYPTGMLLRTPYGQQLAAMVTQADPTFESGNSTARVAARKEFESGGPNSVAGTITSGNAAIKHLGELSDDAEALGNRPFPAWNMVANAFETQTGHPQATNFNNTVGRFGEEATKFYRGIGGSEADVQRDIANLGQNMSPDQIRGGIQKQANLMRDKIVAYQDRWHKVMGPLVPDFPIIDPSTQNVLNKLDKRAGSALPTQGSEPVSAQPSPRNVAPDVTGAPPRKGVYVPGKGIQWQ